MLDNETYHVVHSAVGDSWHRNLPVPSQWNSIDRPHVALLEAASDKMFCFYLSRPSENREYLCVENLDLVEVDSVVEVRYNSTDYRYYRRDGQKWTRIAEKRNQFFLEIYRQGSTPVTLPTSDNDWSDHN